MNRKDIYFIEELEVIDRMHIDGYSFEKLLKVISNEIGCRNRLMSKDIINY